MTILRRLRQLDWPSLTVELVLIFVGITAALWFENRNSARRDRQLEAEVLGEIQRALQSDTSDLMKNLTSTSSTRASIDTILAYFDSGRGYAPALADHFGRSSRHTAFLQDVSAYEYLKAVGLGIVKDHALRSAITRYYEYHVQYLRAVEQHFVEGNWDDTMKPQMMEKFSYRFLFEPAEPLDYNALATDPEYRTALTTTAEILEWKATLTRRVMEQAEALLDALDTELRRR